jgi:hypothetical protein
LNGAFSGPTISLYLPDQDVLLVFGGRNQSLASVELNISESTPKVSLTIHGQDITNPNCRRIIAVLPPTTIGVFNRDDLAYTMRFKPGLEFRMRLDTQARMQEYLSRNEHPIGSRDYSPRVDRIRIYSEIIQTVAPFPRLDVIPLEGVVLYPTSLDNSLCLRLGEGIQSVLSALGPPDEICGHFYNYFEYGIDIKLDSTEKPTIERIILHSNIPGHVLFGRYKPCLMSLRSGTQRKHQQDKEGADEEITFNSLRSLLGEPGEPLVVNDPFWPGTQYFFTFKKGVIAEFTSDETLAALEICI